MSSLHNNHLLGRMAIAIGVAGATGFISVPIAMHLIDSDAAGKFFSDRANAQTSSGQTTTGGGNGQQAPSATQGSQPLQQPNQPVLGPSITNQPQTPLFPGQGTTASPSSTSPQTTSVPAQGSQPTTPQTTTGGAAATGTQTPGQVTPGVQGVNGVNNGASTGQNTVTPGGPGQTATPPTDGVQLFPNGVGGRDDDDNDESRTTSGSALPQGVVSPGVGTPATGITGTQQPRTVVSPGISGSRSNGQSSPTAIQTPTAQQYPLQTSQVSQSSPQSVPQQSDGQDYSQTPSPTSTQPASTTSPSGFNQVTTSQSAGANQQDGQAVRALW